LPICPAPQVNWPEQGEDALNEFNTPDWLARMYPTLFPYGDCQYGEPREYTLTPTEYFGHLMNLRSPRFAQHKRLRYTALNAMQRWRVLEVSSLFVQRALRNTSVQDILRQVRTRCPLHGASRSNTRGAASAMRPQEHPRLRGSAFAPPAR
jgi:hypothetical protein